MKNKSTKPNLKDGVTIPVYEPKTEEEVNKLKDTLARMSEKDLARWNSKKKDE